MASKTILQAVDDPSLAFDPIKVGGDVVLAQHAEVIRALGKRVVHDVIEIGRRLTDAKARCGHGNWLPWLEREFGWSDSTALRYMQAHQFATDKSVTVTDLSLKSLSSRRTVDSRSGPRRGDRAIRGWRATDTRSDQGNHRQGRQR
jgi:hypothetical protein